MSKSFKFDTVPSVHSRRLQEFRADMQGHEELTIGNAAEHMAEVNARLLGGHCIIVAFDGRTDIQHLAAHVAQPETLFS